MGNHRDSDVLSPDTVAGVDVTSSFALLLRARQGDEVARNELCARYLPRLRRWAHGRLPSWAREHLDTEDIVQDALMRSVGRIESFTPEHEGAFCAYVCQALRNRLRDALRRAARRPSGPPPSLDAPALDPSPLEQAVGGQLLARYDALSACANRIANWSSHAWSWASTTPRSPTSAASPRWRQFASRSAARSSGSESRWDMTDDPDDPSLIALGAAVSDGAAVDWGEIEGLADGDDKQRLVRAMRDVETLVAAHRQVDALATNDTPAASARHWQHLVLFEPVGEGAFGTVYRGWDPRLEREVAVKLLRKSPHNLHSPLTEARHLARVRHSNIVVVHGADQDDRVGIWMEYRGADAGRDGPRCRTDECARGHRHRDRSLPRAGRASRRRPAAPRHQGAQRHARARRPNRPDGLQRGAGADVRA
jgi:RNA polymerase sigma factor (sigma-70 family)